MVKQLNMLKDKRYSLRLPSESISENEDFKLCRFSWTSEKELLRRMTGRRRRHRSSTIGDGLDLNGDDNSESDFTEDESCFYRPLSKSQHDANFQSFNRRDTDGGRTPTTTLTRRSASVKDLRSPSLYSRSSPENTMFYNTPRAMKRLSIKPEDGESFNTNDEDGNISDHSTTSTTSYSSVSGSSPKQKRQHRTPLHHHYNHHKRYPLKHAQSVDNLYTSRPSPPRERRILDQNYIFGSTMERSSFRRSSTKNLIKMKSCDNLLLSSPRKTSLHGGTSTLSSRGAPSSGVRRALSRSSSNTPSLMSMKNNLMTSSYRNLADRNVRENPVFDAPTKTLKTSSPYLDRRLAEAKERQSKREAAMKNLDTDFSKAKEIIRKYKSTENLLTIPSTTSGERPLTIETDV